MHQLFYTNLINKCDEDKGRLKHTYQEKICSKKAVGKQGMRHNNSYGKGKMKGRKETDLQAGQR